MKYIVTIILFIALGFSFENTYAQLTVASYFNNHMILQREKENKIWGHANAKEWITVSIDGHTFKTRADKEGTWSAKLPPFFAGGPYSILIADKKDILKIDDVLFGDVWLCSGQSNMEHGVISFPWGKEEMKKASNPNIRFIDIPDRIDEVPRNELPKSVEWKTATGQNIKNLSAVSYWFAKNLQPKVGVPTGLITSAWSGTAIEPWMDIESLEPFPQYKEVIDYLQDDPKPHAQIEKEFQKYLKIEWGPRYYYKGIGMKEKWYEPSTGYSSWTPIKLPTWWENAGIGLEHHDGVVWFRTTFDLPKDFNDSTYFIDLNLIKDYDIVWVNGVKLGETFGDQNWRHYWAPRSILKPKGNSLVVRVYNLGGYGGMNFSPLWATPVLKGKWVCKRGLTIDPDTVPKPRIVNKSPYGYPTAIYNTMIHPLLNINFTGAIWYQGESNAGRAQEYKALFPAMIKCWRRVFNEGNFPFYFVQLANFTKEASKPVNDEWAELRESQAAALKLPNTGMAVAIDIGEADNIHPANKMEVGRRLALQALNKTYHQNVVAQSPSFKSMEIKGGSIIINIETYGDSLICTNKYGYVNGFAVAAKGRKFYWAKANLQGNKIIVYCDKVKKPVDVRYAWSENPGKLNIYNTNHLPLRPFRTDKRSGVTDGRTFDLHKVFF